jgi:uncharacterized protein YndB with AHSA1/START domain
MNEDSAHGETLTIRRVFSAPRQTVFSAWTEPEELRKWWRVGENWTTPLAEVDLKVGGRFTLGTKAPDGDLHIIRGEFREVSPPNRLVYTWSVDGTEPEENEVTVEFRTVGEDTEVTITHARLSSESADSSKAGWEAVLRSLGRVLSLSGSVRDIQPNG